MMISTPTGKDMAILDAPVVSLKQVLSKLSLSVIVFFFNKGSSKLSASLSRVTSHREASAWSVARMI